MARSNHTDDFVIVRVTHGPVCEIVIDSPRSRNALSTAAIEQLTRAIREASAKEDTRVVVVSGAGTGFSSGADIKEAASAE